MSLDTASLEKAIASLADAVQVFKKADPSDEPVYNTLRAGLIQNFEFTFELAWKLFKRWIETNRTLPDDSVTSKREIFRVAKEANLIDDARIWFHFLEVRNRTSHTYQEKNAQEAAETAMAFYTAVKPLPEKLAID